MENSKSITLSEQNGIAFVYWDQKNSKANTLNSSVMIELDEILKKVHSGSSKALVFLSKKSKIFIAGADINEIKDLKTEQEFDVAVKLGQDMINKIEDLKIPVIAAIHGACLGGGCELAIACDYRIMTDDPSSKIGLPETKLGIFPGFGGCVRLPRIVGIESALNLILKGSSISAARAKKMGLVDKVVNVGHLEKEAMFFAKKLIKKGAEKRPKKYKARGIGNKLKNSLLKSVVFSTAKKGVLSQTQGHYPAPIKAIEVIQETLGMSDRQRALNIERKAFCEVGVTDISKNLINLFFMTEKIKGSNGVSGNDEKGYDINSLVVLGAGTMGGGIAYAAADKGIYASLKDLSQDAIDKGIHAARSIWKRKLKRRRITKFQLAEKQTRVNGFTDNEGFKDCDVIIEAIVENMDIKKKVIAEIAAIAKPDCIFATNTSSLKVTEMSEAHPKPENFVGMHFFNPVDKMPLVEVIRGEKTGDKAVSTIYNLAKTMGKIPVVVKDAPGFLVNRLLIPYLLEAAFFLEEGLDVEYVDNIIKKKFGMPMGPFRLMDEVGLDVCIKVSKIFRESLGERIQIPKIMDKLSDTDRLGKKNKKGFYIYDSNSKSKKQEVDNSIYSALGLGTPNKDLSEEDVIRRSFYSMVNEATQVLKTEEIVGSAEDLDLSMIMGTGFPPFRGGLMKYADKEGLQNILKHLETYHSKYGLRFKPVEALKTMVEQKQNFYS